MTTELSTILALIAAVAVAVAAIGLWWINRVPRIRRDEPEALPLFGDFGTTVSNLKTEPRSLQAISADPSAGRRAPLREVSNTAIPVSVTANVPAHAPPILQLSPTPSIPVDAPVLSDTGVPGVMVEGRTVRFSVAAEGSLPSLPGRLDIVDGADAGRQIRFVRVPGPDGTDVTFGRTGGPLYRHVQFRDKTISRQHAVMQFREGRWTLRNLSRTNPVVLNHALLDTLDVPSLQDGDRIEMGEVTFTFRSH
jgi:hypothetical protein